MHAYAGSIYQDVSFFKTFFQVLRIESDSLNRRATEITQLVGKPGSFIQARQAVHEREQSMPTGLEHGIAIPHGRTDAVSGLVCAIGRKREGVDFGALDGAPSRIFVLTLAPRGAMTPHVQLMAELSQRLGPEGRSRVLEASSAEEIYRVFVTDR